MSPPRSAPPTVNASTILPGPPPPPSLSLSGNAGSGPVPRPPMSTWRPSSPPAPGNSNARRIQRARHAFGDRSAPQSDGTAAPPSKRPRHGSRSVSVPKATDGPTTFVVVILPLPIPPHPDADGYVYRIHEIKLRDLLERLQLCGLFIRISVPQTTAMDDPVWELFNDAITTHLSINDIKLQPPPPGVQIEGICFEKLDWHILVGGNRQATGQRLNPVPTLVSYDFTIRRLTAIASKVRNPIQNEMLLFAAPRWGRLVGPVHMLTPSLEGIHECYANRVMDKFWDIELMEESENPECEDGCERRMELHANDPLPGELSDDEFPSTAHELLEAAHNNNSPAQTTGANDTGLEIVQDSRQFSGANPDLARAHEITGRMAGRSASNDPAYVSSDSDSGASLPMVIDATRLNLRRLRTRSTQATDANITHQTVSDWHYYLESSIVYIDPTEELNIEGVSVEHVANALISYLEWHHSGQTTPFVQPAGTSVEPCSIRNMLKDPRKFTCGIAPGDGPERAVIRYAVRNVMCADPEFVRPQNEGYTLVLRPTNSISSTARQNKFRAYGTLCALHIAWLGLCPDPISPFLIQSILGGPESLINLEFIGHISPSLAVELSAWPSNHAEELPTGLHSPVALLVSQALNLSMIQVRTTDINEREALTREIYVRMVLGESYHFDTHVDYQAFREGFNIRISREKSFIETFGSNPLHLVARMSDKHVKTPDDVISHLRYISRGAEFAHHEANWRQRFERYLRGPGHPIHEMLGADVITATRRELVQDDYTFRSTRFLGQISGCELIPSAENWRITIRFTAELPQDYAKEVKPNAELADDAPPIFFRGCIFEAWVVLNETTIQLMEQDIPDDLAVGNDFDVWVHHAMLNLAESDEFNAV
ncbi:hypothetical protein BD410DRAFT_834985 [Rickenella mellea]|uniref:Uncharacterized protein n=1 Tax=Rickenella mellea TaxID=50990 RepID=A0A4Y7QMW0_9AGAM|nr:hypothetical protein BD410DRAFT_834985 [Rickenella mellea]